MISISKLISDTRHYLCDKFQVLTAASRMIRAFCDTASCDLAGADRRFRDAYCLHHQTNHRTSETPVSSETTRYYNPEGSIIFKLPSLLDQPCAGHRTVCDNVLVRPIAHLVGMERR
jgi:hypothetical protein